MPCGFLHAVSLAIRASQCERSADAVDPASAASAALAATIAAVMRRGCAANLMAPPYPAPCPCNLRFARARRTSDRDDVEPALPAGELVDGERHRPHAGGSRPADRC